MAMETCSYNDFEDSFKNFIDRCEDSDSIKQANQLAGRLKILDCAVQRIQKSAERFDSRTGCRGNGYNSLAKVGNILRFRCKEALELKEEYLDKKIRTWSEAVESYIQILRFAELLLKKNPDSLYPEQTAETFEKYREFSDHLLSLNVAPFYGEAVAFNFEENCRRFMYSLAVSFASMSDVFGGSILSKIKRLKKSNYCRDYLLDSDALGKQIAEVAKEQQIYFVKSFFNFTENKFLSSIRALPYCSTSYLHSLYFGRINVEKKDGTVYQVPVPTASINKNYVDVRLVTDYRTDQMIGTCLCSFFCRCESRTPSPFIMFHVHGGGFVSQTSKSHEDYLRQWAKKLRIPILSVDYSLAPEAAYPRAIEEVLYSYCWMLNNSLLLGSTAEKIILCGDSAGGNFAAGLQLKCLENNIRSPDALMLSYAALNISFFPSPSRLLSLIDPMLMCGTLVRCLNSYQDPGYLASLPRTIEEELNATTFTHDMYLSPILAPQSLLSRFPETILITTDMDPCLDDSVLFSNNLVDAGVTTSLEILPDLPHGFISFSSISTTCNVGLGRVTNILKDLKLRLEKS